MVDHVPRSSHCSKCIARHRKRWWANIIEAVTGIGECGCGCHDWFYETGHWQ